MLPTIADDPDRRSAVSPQTFVQLKVIGGKTFHLEEFFSVLPSPMPVKENAKAHRAKRYHQDRNHRKASILVFVFRNGNTIGKHPNVGLPRRNPPDRRAQNTAQTLQEPLAVDRNYTSWIPADMSDQ